MLSYQLKRNFGSCLKPGEAQARAEQVAIAASVFYPVFQPLS